MDIQKALENIEGMRELVDSLVDAEETLRVVMGADSMRANIEKERMGMEGVLGEIRDKITQMNQEAGETKKTTTKLIEECNAALKATKIAAAGDRKFILGQKEAIVNKTEIACKGREVTAEKKVVSLNAEAVRLQAEVDRLKDLKKEAMSFAD